MLVFSGSGCCSRTWRTVRVGSADCPRGAQQPVVRCVLREFLSRFVSICLADRFWLDLVGRTVRPVRPDCPRWADCRGELAVRLNFGGCILEVRVAILDHPPAHRGLSARSSRTVHLKLRRVPKSFASWVELLCCFELGFVPRVGRSVGLHDLGKLVWELLVVNLGHKPSSSFGKNFYRHPFTPPLSGRLIGPSTSQSWAIATTLFREVVRMHSSRGSCIGSRGACMCAGGALYGFRALDWWFVLFAWACFVSNVSSCYRCLRGPRLIFFKWSCCLPFFGFRSLVGIPFSCFFSFPFSLNYQNDK
jgi:hypothetical protein